jgi:hypothetical protein
MVANAFFVERVKRGRVVSLDFLCLDERHTLNLVENRVLVAFVDRFYRVEFTREKAIQEQVVQVHEIEVAEHKISAAEYPRLFLLENN